MYFLDIFWVKDQQRLALTQQLMIKSHCTLGSPHTTTGMPQLQPTLSLETPGMPYLNPMCPMDMGTIWVKGRLRPLPRPVLTLRLKLGTDIITVDTMVDIMDTHTIVDTTDTLPYLKGSPPLAINTHTGDRSIKNT